LNARVSCATLVLTILLAVCFSLPFSVFLSRAESRQNLTSQETQVAALVNGTRVYNFDLELEKIALNHSVSNYSFRSGGSAGATTTAFWLRDKLQGFGLEAGLEPFEFTTWDLLSKPSMVIDVDRNPNTISDQIPIPSFQSEHLSWSTPQNGVFADLVVLPLPVAAQRSEVGANSIDMSAWNAVNTTGKIVLIGKEVRWATSWANTFLNKLESQPPAAVVFTWWYDWMSFSPASYGSISGHTYWSLKIPVGSVDYQDGQQIRNQANTLNPSAHVKIDSVIGSGIHYNVVGKILGAKNPDKLVIVSGHYDTVVTSGFGDNGAGTAGVLELARIFSEANESGSYKPDYTLVFVAFASEEFWLVGSVNYVKQHKSEMANITAVINLDCIGSDDLAVTETDSAGSFDLDATILQSAQDLGVSATIESPGGSDQETFRDPYTIGGSYAQNWGVGAGISDAKRVKSSAMVISYPLFPTDIWSRGKSGWIHTSFDNSSSTQTLNWVEPARLEEQVKVVTLSVMRISPSSPESFGTSPLSWLILGIGVTAAGVFVAVTIVYVVKRRKPSRKDTVEEPSRVGQV